MAFTPKTWENDPSTDTPLDADGLNDLETRVDTGFDDAATATAAKQDTDSDLTAIAALSPSNDDVIQRKAGAWTNRTPAQVKTDLALVKGDVGLGNVDNTSDANKPVSTAQAAAIAALANTYRMAIPWRVQDITDAHTAGTWAFMEGLAAPVGLSTDNGSLGVVYLDPADYAVSGLTTKYRVRASLLTNANAAVAVTLTVGLYAITAVAGGADAITMTPDTVVSGSTVAFATQAQSTRGQNNSGDFTAPAAGWYALAAVNSGTVGANAQATLAAALQVRNV